MTEITNTNATEDTKNRYNVCQVSGFKAKPGELVQRWDGLWVLPKFNEERHPQDRVRTRHESQQGSIRPEGADTFITTLVSADDL